MKILFSTSDNSLRSGAFRSTAHLASELSILGVDSIVLLPRKGDGEMLLDELGVPHRFVRSFNWVKPMGEKSFQGRAEWFVKRAYNRRIAMPKIRSICQEEQINLVHVCGTWGYNAAEAARSLRLPYVWHIREHIEKGQGLSFCDKSYATELMGESAFMVAISDKLKRDYEAIVPNARITRVYNGIDPNRYYFGERNILENDVVRICIVGGIVEGKGQGLLIDALAKMLEHSSSLPVRLIIVGGTSPKGRSYESLLRQKIADYGLRDVVEFTGNLTEPERVLRECDICVSCTAYEAFGRTIVEGMMAGCLAVGSNSGGVPEIIRDGETGYLFDAGSSDDLARVLEGVVTHKDKSRTIAAAGQQDASERFTAKRNAENVLRVYEQVFMGEAKEKLA